MGRVWECRLRKLQGENSFASVVLYILFSKEIERRARTDEYIKCQKSSLSLVLLTLSSCFESTSFNTLSV